METTRPYWFVVIVMFVDESISIVRKLTLLLDVLQRSHAGRSKLKEQFFGGWFQLNETAKHKIGHQLEHMLLDCSYNGEHCSAEYVVESFNLFSVSINLDLLG